MEGWRYCRLPLPDNCSKMSREMIPTKLTARSIFISRTWLCGVCETSYHLGITNLRDSDDTVDCCRTAISVYHLRLWRPREMWWRWVDWEGCQLSPENRDHSQQSTALYIHGRVAVWRHGRKDRYRSTYRQGINTKKKERRQEEIAKMRMLPTWRDGTEAVTG